jgi:hypothetical protein
MCIPTILDDSQPTGERYFSDFEELTKAVGQIYPTMQAPTPFPAVIRTDTMVRKDVKA